MGHLLQYLVQSMNIKEPLKLKKKTIYMILIQFAYTDHEAKIQK